jgi:hypothetical protein
MSTAWAAIYCYAGTAGIVLVTMAMSYALVRELRASARSGRDLFPEEEARLQGEVGKA